MEVHHTKKNSLILNCVKGFWRATRTTAVPGFNNKFGSWKNKILHKILEKNITKHWYYFKLNISAK